ncbi:penicillin-binding protein activator LpoB [Frischella sp. Ac48]|uniref:Penicillin-binding protein activator LpoB n=1 Tax=Frischella japonica TaxID=2741544 RepID=A0ABR7R086_9GAMM|nr:MULTISPECIES: penicillin-binding protein activator LpoB [Frischella]MBC9131730.1 penicillin-binding protein activator LpoB [Frischella japonica]MBX4134178.1 penicillin-binding protein activator LpoB [Frischella sp. Ac48]
MKITKPFYKTITAITLGLTLTLVGCSSNVEYVTKDNAEDAVTLGLDNQDFEQAAQESLNSLLTSNALNKPGGGRYVVAIGKMINDTTIRIDTDMLVKKIRIGMLQSGKAVVTTAVAGDNKNVDDLIYDVRELRDNDEFKQQTIAGKGTLYAPDLSLTGKIAQRIARTGKNKQLVEYYLQLTLTDIKSGLAYWENESVVRKLGSNKSTAW